jgi:hypothetical protein
MIQGVLWLGGGLLPSEPHDEEHETLTGKEIHRPLAIAGVEVEIGPIVGRLKFIGAMEPLVYMR